MTALEAMSEAKPGGHLVGPIRNRIDRIIAEFHEWAEGYLQGEEDIIEAFEAAVESGDFDAAKALVKSYRAVWKEEGSPGMYALTMDWLGRLRTAVLRLNRAEERELRTAKAKAWKEGV